MALEASGKKVIFLYPPNMIEDICAELSRSEFEICMARDHDKLVPYLKAHGDCLVYVNIDQGMKPAEWDGWIRERKAESPGLGFGILTMNEDKRLAQRFLMDLGVSCGFIVMKFGPLKAAQMMIKTLEAAEARGRRKYVRSEPGAAGGEFNVSVHGSLERGKIADISSVGIAFSFESSASFPQGQILEDMQLNLRGARLTVRVVVMGKRVAEGELTLHIGIFTPDSLDDVKRAKLRTFVQKSVQEAFEKDLG